MTAWPLLPVIAAGFLTWAGSVIEDGWQARRAERKNGMAALGRCVERARRFG